jgi:predicted nucleic acid-binding protein
MTFADVPSGATVFIDANIFLFALTKHPVHGAASEAFLERIAQEEIAAAASTHVLGEVAHRIMTIEACDRFGWPVQGIANRLRRHPNEVQQLVRPRQALDEISFLGIVVHPVTPALVSMAVDVWKQLGLLHGDALIVAVMKDQNLSHLVSLDSDFDRVPGIVRYAPA